MDRPGKQAIQDIRDECVHLSLQIVQNYSKNLSLVSHREGRLLSNQRKSDDWPLEDQPHVESDERLTLG